MVNERLSVGVSYCGEFIQEMLRSLRGRLGGRGRLVSTDIVRSFFEERSAKMTEHMGDDVISIGTAPYQALISASMIRDEVTRLNSGSRIIDYGCGSGNILGYLRGNGYCGYYDGYDIDRVRIDGLSNSSSDTRDCFFYCPPSHSIDTFDVAFLSNVCVYNQDSEVRSILDALRESAGEGSSIVVIEPYPKWYWEFEFNGIRLIPRDMDRIEQLLRSSGWGTCKCIDVSLFVVKGAAIFPISYALVARLSE